MITPQSARSRSVAGPAAEHRRRSLSRVGELARHCRAAPVPVRRAAAGVFAVGLFPGLFVASWRLWDALDRTFELALPFRQPQPAESIPLAPTERAFTFQPLPEALPTWSDWTIRNFGIGVCVFGALCGLGVLLSFHPDERPRLYRWLAAAGLTVPCVPLVGIGILMAFIVRCWPAASATSWARRTRAGQDPPVHPPDTIAAGGGGGAGRDGGHPNSEEIAHATPGTVRWIDARPRRLMVLLVAGITLAFVPAAVVAITGMLERYGVLEYVDDSLQLLAALYLDDRVGSYSQIAASEDPGTNAAYLALLYAVWFVLNASKVGSLALLLAVFRSQSERAHLCRVLAASGLIVGQLAFLWWVDHELGGGSFTADLVWSLL